ncbi:MAG: Nif3-like dinuclear metal center hexameric protein [Clostridia bacterium]|nr:Nif3-like dinuclear metal center hexameric protein [Clostridia bacterium]
MTVREIVQAMIRKTGVPQIPDDRTCDHLMAGSWDTEVTGIVSTFMATVDVIKQAVTLGANLIITHEPTWFTGRDATDWLAGDAVYEQKKQLIDSTGMAIWRFHDHMHADHDDGIYRGFDLQTGWGKYRMPVLYDPGAPSFLQGKFDGCYEIPPTTLRDLCEELKQSVGLTRVRVIGDPDMPVSRVGLLPGGGSLGLGTEEMPMKLMRRRKLDVILCGDITEWTLPAYARDAAQLGLNKAIIVLGHERSEEPGMQWLHTWMKELVGDTPMWFADAKEPFLYL